MYYFCSDYPIRPLRDIPEAEIQEVLGKAREEGIGFRIRGEEGKRVALIPEAWLEYLLDTDHEERIYDMLHRAMVNAENPEPAFRYISGSILILLVFGVFVTLLNAPKFSWNS